MYRRTPTPACRQHLRAVLKWQPDDGVSNLTPVSGSYNYRLRASGFLLEIGGWGAPTPHDNNIIVESREIMAELEAFYSQLYFEPPESDEEMACQGVFLNSIKTSQLSELQSQSIETPITNTECFDWRPATGPYPCFVRITRLLVKF